MNPTRVVVVGLGPAGPDLTTSGAIEAIDNADHLVLRTGRHPAAVPFADAETCDDLYDAGATFEDVYRSIVERLVDRSRTHGSVTYAIPGSPDVLERTVALLRADPGIEVATVAGMSFLDLAWGRLGVDPVEASVRLIDGHRFAIAAAGATGALLVAHCHANHVLSDIKLAYDDNEPASAIILQRLGLPDERITEVAWSELDRTVVADHLTSVFIPAADAPVANELVRFHGLVQTLREQCPWDRAQTHESLVKYLIEETYELVDAIDALASGREDAIDDLEEELGDVLFQVVFHAVLAAERGDFTLGDVAKGIHDKLHARHPHVFDVAVSSDPDAVIANWEHLKAEEKGRTSILDGIPAGLPSLALADKLLSKAERLGAPAPPPAESDDLGGQILTLVHQARTRGDDADALLRGVLAAYRARLRTHETGGDPEV